MKVYYKNYSSNFDAHYNDIDRVQWSLKMFDFLVKKLPSPTIIDSELENIVLLTRYLACPIFEKKYSAITFLNQRIEVYSKYAEKEKDKYRQMFLSSGVLAILYNRGYHPEIAKKSGDLLAFLAPRLKVEVIKSLMKSSFNESSEKGGVICYCLRRSLQILDIDLIKSVLEILTTEISIEKIEPETIQLIIEIIKQSGEKTNRFYFMQKNKDGNKIIEDSIQLLWNCLDSRNNLTSAAVKTVLEALEDNIGKSKGGKPKMIEHCIGKLRQKKCMTQYIVLLKGLLDSLDSKGSFITGSEYDKLMEKVYNINGQPLANLAFEEFVETCKNGASEEDQVFNEDKFYGARLHLILILIFKGKQKVDAVVTFKKLFSFLLSNHDQQKNFERCANIMIVKDLITTENSDTFFSVMNDHEAIDDSFIKTNIFNLYENLFIRINMKTGAMEYSASKKNLINIVRQEKIMHLKQLWIFCLKRRLAGYVKECFNKLLVECYFRGARKYETTEAQRAWTNFTNDVTEEMSIIKQGSNPVAKAILTGNMAGIWIKAIDISAGVTYIGSNKATDEKPLKIYVKLSPTLGRSGSVDLPPNSSINHLKNTIIDAWMLEEIDISLLYNGRVLSIENMETVDIQTASDHYFKNVQNRRDGYYLEVEVVPIKEERGLTAFSLRKKMIGSLANNTQFEHFFEMIDLDTSDNIWKLLSTLPSNKQIRAEIMQVPEQKNVLKFTDLRYPKRTLYYLNVMQKILFSQTKDQEYIVKVISSGELEKLADFVSKKYRENLDNPSSITTIIRGIFPLLDYFTETGYSLDRDIQMFYFTAVTEIIKAVVDDSSKYSPEYIKDALEHFMHLLKNIEESPKNTMPEVDWTDIFKKAIIFNKSKAVRNLFSDLLVEVLVSSRLPEFVFVKIITPLYTSTMEVAYENIEQSGFYFHIASNIIKQCENEERENLILDLLDFKQCWSRLMPTILECNDENLIKCIFKFLTECLKKKTDLKQWAEENKEVLIKIISICLIDQNGKQSVKPVCRNSESRSAFLTFLNFLIFDEPSVEEPIFSYFLNIIGKGRWRKKLYKDWNIEIFNSSQSGPQTYAGLVNLGSTCYMNSIFQQIFMIKDLRDYLIEADGDYGDQAEKNVLFQFQIVMKGLRDNVRRDYNPKSFCGVFKNVDGSQINVCEQMDADEFFNNLMDQLETELKKSAQQDVVKRTFGGKVVQEIISSGCEHRSTQETDFLTLNIEVKGVNSITQSLDRMVAGEILDGENKYKCEVCDKKVRAVKRDSVKKLPNKLIFVLKRFEFNYESLSKVKLNSYCEFPEKIDMKKYFQEYLNESNPQRKLPESYFNYNLRGVTIHKGTAESGHYLSLIKDQAGAWYEFNDVFIREFNFEQMPDIAFGQDVESDGGQLVRNSRGTNAYMLFYERDDVFDEEDRKIDHLLQGVRESSHIIRKYATDKILTENFDYYLKQVFFDLNYARFVHCKASTMDADKLCSKEHELLLKLGFSTFLILLVRKKQKEMLPEMYTLLVTVLKKNLETAQWFISNASNPEFFEEFFIDCLILDMKSFFYGLVQEAIKNIMSSCGEEPSVNNIESYYSYSGSSPINPAEVQKQPQVVEVMETTNTDRDETQMNDSLGGLESLVIHPPEVEKTQTDDDKAKNPDVKVSKPSKEPLTPETSKRAIELVKNFLLLALKTIQSNKSNEKFLPHIYRIIHFCSNYPTLASYMSQIEMPEFIINFLGYNTSKADQGSESQPKEYFSQNFECPDSAFKGYIRIKQAEVRIMSIDDAVLERKGEAIANSDFRINSTYIISACCRVLIHERKNNAQLIAKILEEKIWVKMLESVYMNCARRALSRLVLLGTDEVSQFEKVIAVLEDEIIGRAKPDPVLLKSSLYMLKHFVSERRQENFKKKAVKVLNIMVNIIDGCRVEHYDYSLNYLFKMMKECQFLFEKFIKEGKNYIPVLSKKMTNYTAFVIKEYNQSKANQNTQKAPVHLQDIEYNAPRKKKRRERQFQLIQEEDYKEFCNSIFYDSDTEFEVTDDVALVDYRESANTWLKDVPVSKNLGVMFQLDLQKPKWFRDDCVDVAMTDTASKEYLYKVDIM